MEHRVSFNDPPKWEVQDQALRSPFTWVPLPPTHLEYPECHGQVKGLIASRRKQHKHFAVSFQCFHKLNRCHPTQPRIIQNDKDSRHLSKERCVNLSFCQQNNPKKISMLSYTHELNETHSKSISHNT